MAGIILDTGPLVALIDDTQEYHSWVTYQLRELKAPLLTCDAVLSETGFLLRSHPGFLRHLAMLFKSGLIESSSMQETTRIFELMETYASVPMSFADACLVSMVEHHPGSIVFTLDRDFTIYRQQRRRVIPLLAPF